MAKLSEVVGLLAKSNETLSKALGEITKAIARLNEQLSNCELPPEAEAELTRTVDLAKALDDIIPDAIVETPPVEPPPAEEPPPADQPTEG